MKKPSNASLRLRLTALAPGNWRDTVNRHPQITNLIAVIIILLVVVDVGRQLGLPGNLFTTRHSFASRPKPLKFLNVRDLHCPARFITAMVSDGHGGAWVASEDSGIYHYQPGRAWQHYDQANSPGLVSNHIYSLCLDAKGRLWAGTLRHGVCVYNGAKWGHYGLLNGPLGSHIFAIVENPYDKSVWMCTEAGVSIYHIAADSVGGGVGNANPTRRFTVAGQWQYIPQAAPVKPGDLTAFGLPPNPDCVAFNAEGAAFVGSQSNGLEIGYPPYHSWWMVKGPWKVPIRPFGKGLPSSLINAVVAGKHGRIYVATDEGLAWNNPGNPYIFQYERGADYARKILGLWKPPARFKMPSRAFLNHLLSGDHVTCLAVDKVGELWLGTWRNGLWINTLNHTAPKQGQIRELTPGVRRFSGALLARRRWWLRSIKLKKAGVHDITAVIGPQPPAPSLSRFVLNMFYVSAILPLANGQILIGHYGCGVTVGRLVPQTLMGRLVVTVSRLASDLEPGPFWHASLPAAAKAPTTAQLTTLYHSILKNNIPSRRAGTTDSQVVSIADDWRTQGNWIDRYGTFADVCASMNGDGCDQAGGYENSLFTYRSWVGPAGGPRDYLRYWVQWVHSKQNRVLQNLNAGGRKESEWDDHGEATAVTQSGLGVFCTMYLPKGVFGISAYCVNKDGHFRSDRDRDYVASLCRTPMSESLFLALGRYPAAAHIVWATVRHSHQIAHSRVCQFWGGVYVRFVFRQAAPGYITLALHRNFSFNTITCGVFVNRVNAPNQRGACVTLSPLEMLTLGTQPGAAGQVDATATRAAVGLLNNVLAFRCRHPLAYMRNAAALNIPILRYFLRPGTSGKMVAARVSGLRRSLALLARDVGLFSLADRIHPPRRLFESYCWKGRTRSGQGMKWQWKQSGYDRYLIKLRKKFIASRWPQW